MLDTRYSMPDTPHSALITPHFHYSNTPPLRYSLLALTPARLTAEGNPRMLWYRNVDISSLLAIEKEGLFNG